MKFVVNRMLADPRTFPNIGEAKGERDDLRFFSKVTPNATECNFVFVEPPGFVA